MNPCLMHSHSVHQTAARPNIAQHARLQFNQGHFLPHIFDRKRPLIIVGLVPIVMTVLVFLAWTTDCRASDQRGPAAAGARPDWICSSKDGTHFVRSESGVRFVPWGFNYDHDDAMRLLEDYWNQEWQTVVEDFKEMKALGANTVRIHLQVARFMKSPQEPDSAALEQLARLVRLAEDTGLYLDLTGLGCYRKKSVPAWYSSMNEAGRWNVQALFWRAVAKVGAQSPAVFCYDLMNEPILPGADEKETDWLAGEFAGMNFVQRLTLELAGRSREQVAGMWVERLVAAIRAEDPRHLVTVGEIPWAFVFPGAKPLFSGKTGKGLDFVSVHFYPKKGEVAKALAALSVYNLGKPLVVEEMFPLECSVEELDAFIKGSSSMADGWIGFYWGKTIDDYSTGGIGVNDALTRRWLEYFRAKTPEIIGPGTTGQNRGDPP